jgi:putative peptide zinc metalloprotease protein
MDTTAPASELERRKSVRIRLRADLNIDAQKYEGRTYYVVKDPVSLRYYRLKDNEHFLLQFLDGKHTLEDAQKAYEKQYRPDRLKLEDMEGFAQQLLTAGLAQSEAPKAGKQLFERRKKRRRSEWIQTLTNILYIKLPIIDPDRLLAAMIKGLRAGTDAVTGHGLVFFTLLLLVSAAVVAVSTLAGEEALLPGYPAVFILKMVMLPWLALVVFRVIHRFGLMAYVFLSVLLMLGALLLVATNFAAVRAKMPDYQVFFQFKNVVYMWVALGAVKIIHEFGHGLSCKYYGGEVHEMGALFLCLSPALYCNVSDAWVLPNKWHRIVISAAGIYVELVIAAIATFWWWYAKDPFYANMALSLMVVCSVSTVVFNANPLMRYDGYYVLADWLEIPNLRERSNRFLSNLVLEHCLGVEVQPEGYMELGRRVLFVSYAIVSYIYRWVVTFSILYFMYNFLRPYKLEVLSSMLALASLGTMVGWPIYRLGKNLHRRGRLPDMKRWRVTVTCSAVAALVLFVCLAPLPISRVRRVGLVQPHPEDLSQVVVQHGGYLTDLKVQPGDTVRAGQVLAVFRNPELEMNLLAAQEDLQYNKTHRDQLERRKLEQTDPKDREKTVKELAEVNGRLLLSEATVKKHEVAQRQLVLYSPRDGVIGQGPRANDVGKYFPASGEAQAQEAAPPLFTVIRPGRVRVCVPVETPDFHRLGESLAAAGEAGRLEATVRVHGMVSDTWTGQVVRLEQSEAKTVPMALTTKCGGPVEVRATPGAGGAMVPQTQYYLAYVEIEDPDRAIAPGVLAQVKVHCRYETCLSWTWRYINSKFSLRLL